MRKQDIQLIKRYWDHVNDREPEYPMPCIVYWQKGNVHDGYYYSGELLTEQTPNGEICRIADFPEDLIKKLISRYEDYTGEEVN